MAVMTIYTPLIFAGGVGVVTVANANQITIVSGTVTQNYFGSGFTYSGSSVIGGTVTSTNLYDSSNGGLQYSITGLFHDAFTVANYVLSGNAAGLREFLLSGNDTLNGSSGNDYLEGYQGLDFLVGSGGSDTLYGGGQADTLVGGTGDDVYFYYGSETIIENAGEGRDRIEVDFSFTLPDQIEDLQLYSNALNGTGNTLNNYIVGNASGNTLDGGAGNDTLLGGAGDDTYIIDSVLDVIFEFSGLDTANVSINGYVLAGGVENLLLGTSVLSGTGNSDANALTGNALNNVLGGAAGNDTLDGGVGADTMSGGADDDTYIVDDAGDVIDESGGSGVDTVRSNLGISLAGNAGIENVTLLGIADISATGNDGANRLIGNGGANALSGADGNDTLDGGVGVDTLDGGAGDDHYVVDTSLDVVVDSAGYDTVASAGSYILASGLERLILTANGTGVGNAADNALIGSASASFLDGLGGNDTLSGGGVDTLAGGSGNDWFVVSGSAKVVESSGEGEDLVQAASSYSLAGLEHVENLLIVAAGAVSGTGNSANNVITTGSSNDSLDGGAGLDTLIGANGNDTYVVDNPDDVIVEGADAGVDSVLASSTYTLGSGTENLTLTGSAHIDGFGNSLNNSLRGNSGNNFLNGNAGADNYYASAGDDTYVLEAGDSYSELFGNDTGFDTIWVNTTYSIDSVLLRNLEGILLTEAGALDATGNIKANRLTGNSSVNVLTGLGGNDTLDGGGGNDTLDGGDGFDSLVGGSGDDYFLTDGGDSIRELADGGYDTVIAPFGATLQGEIEALILTGTAVAGTGNATANLIVGNGSANLLGGGGGDDTLDGGQGNDTLNGDTGADSLSGGTGDDIYYVDDPGDVVMEGPGGGNDSVISASSYTLESMPDVEELVLQSQLMRIDGTGNDAANYIGGTQNDNWLVGGAGNDFLIGWGGSDTIDGGLGDDTMSGYGSGPTIFIIDSAGDYLFETGNWDGYTNTVISSINIVLQNFDVPLQNLLLGGTADINGTGNGWSNHITGNNGNNVLDGGSSNDTLIGGLGDDTLYGDDGNDLLDGGTGYDTLFGGTGNDYIVLGDVLDLAVENPGEGNDTVEGWQYDVFLDTMPDVEHLVFRDGYARSGHGNAGHNSLKGNTSNNLLNGANGNDTLDGGGGADTLIGGGGDDTYWLRALAVLTENSGEGVDTVIADVNHVLANHFENLLLSGAAVLGTGNAVANRITGNSAGNQLDGGAGADTLEGGMGDDRYWADDVGDVIVEAAGGGYDIVYSSTSLGSMNNVEVLVLTGSGHVAATGNSGNNILSGNSGNNTLDGGGGADIIAGGPGNDTYVVDNSGDQVMELGNSGIDAVQSGVSYDLMQAWHVENLTLTGGSVVNGSGNWLDNLITGNAAANRLEGNRGNDTINGGGGSDTLVGGLGDDVLVWDALDTAVQGGAGSDTLLIDGSGVTLNLTSIADTLITDVEIIDLTGSGNNTLTLGLADVLAISSTGDVLRVDGNSGDAVNAGAGWTGTGSQMIGAQNYAAYAQGVATLLVDSDITVNLV